MQLFWKLRSTLSVLHAVLDIKCNFHLLEIYNQATRTIAESSPCILL